MSDEQPWRGDHPPSDPSQPGPPDSAQTDPSAASWGAQGQEQWGSGSTAYPGGGGWDGDSGGQDPSGAFQAPGGQGPRRRRWIRPLITLGIIGALAAGGAIVDAVTSADRDESGSVVGSGDVSSADVAVGDCLIDPLAGEDEGEVDDIRAVPCTEPHDLEVYALGTLPDGEYPADEELDTEAGDVCVTNFDAYVGTAYEDSRLDLGFITPSAEAWDDGDRGVSCFLFELDGTQRSETARDAQV